MNDIQSAKSPPASTILPFYATASISFLALTILMFFSAESFTTHFFNPHLLSVVHTAALGWGTMIIFGAGHQLLPVVCEKDLYSPKLAQLSYYFLTVGAAFLIAAFWNFKTGIVMIIAGSLIVLASLLFFINTIGTSNLKKNFTFQNLFIVSSSFWLVFTTTVGLILAINLSHPFFEKNHIEILKLHAHIGLAGWFLQLISGVSSRLVPMFLLGKSKIEKILKPAFYFQNLGLIGFLIYGYFFQIDTNTIVFALLSAIGIFCWMYFLFDNFKNRIRKKVDWNMKHVAVSMISLVIGLIFLFIIIFSTKYNIAITYGTLLFMGWITGIILSMTFKTLPFIIWNKHYKDLSGKVKVPLPRDLYNDKLIQYQFYIFIIALLSLLIGILIQNVLVIKIAAFIWFVLSLIYLYNIVKTFTHKTTIQS